MGYVIRMPQMGMSMDRGTVVEWAVEEGDEVEADAVIVVVESEKASNEVEAREDGLLRSILVPADGAVEPGTPIGIVAGSDEDLAEYEAQIDGEIDYETPGVVDGAEVESGDAAAADTGGVTANAQEVASEQPRASGRAGTDDVRATPGARRLAETEGVDVSAVEGTGPQSVVTDEDVRSHLESGSDEATSEDVRATPGARRLAEELGVDVSAVEGTGPQGVVTDEDVEAHDESAPATAGTARTAVETRKLAGIQRTVAERLSESYANAVHVTLNRSFDATTLRAVRSAAKSNRNTADVSITDLLLKAVADALEAHPEFNALFEGEEHRLIAEANVGVAVDVQSGLVTPVVPSVGERSVETVSRIRRELTERVASGEFSTDDVSGGTFTVSNLGPYGVDDFDPIINPPQVAILGVGRVRDDGTMTLSLSFDHRVVNGADAAQFLDSLVGALTDAATLAGYFEANVTTAETPEEREVRVTVGDGYAGQYRTTFGGVAFDEPESIGGTGTAPSPVDHLLGALGSCLSITVRDLARRDGIELDAVDATVDGSPTDGALEAIDVELELGTDADEADVDALVTKAERGCYVSRALSDDLPVTVEWTRA